MSLRAILLDRFREVFPLLGDIFNVTGHKLLIATNDKMFKELLESTDTDIVILNQSDINVWLPALSMDKAPLPFFLLSTEEEENKIRSVGFSELNYIQKPFNPLELLNKLSYLHNLSPEEGSQQLGFISSIVKLKNSKKHAVIELKDSKECSILIEEGNVVGITTSIEELKKILERDHTLSVKAPRKVNIKTYFLNSEDFIKSLISSLEIHPSFQATSYAEGGLKPVEEVAEGVYRISKLSSFPSLIKNVYLRIYEGSGKRIAMLINMGSLDEWSTIKNTLDDVLRSFTELDAVVLLSGELASIYNSFILAEQNPNLRFITDHTIKRQLSEGGLKASRIRTFGDFTSYVAGLATGHRLKFIPVNFSPSTGAFCMYEEDTGYLFTPELLSSLYSENLQNIVQDVRLYHRIFMPSGSILGEILSKLEGLKVNKVLPRHGLPYDGFEEVIRTLQGMRAGIDFSPVGNMEKAVSILKGVIDRVVELEDKKVVERFLEELSRFCNVEGLSVSEVYFEPSFTVELILNTLTHTPNIKASTVVSVLSELDRAGVFITPF